MKQSAFTLVELMVVTAIIAILAAIGIPNFRSYMLQNHLEEAKPYLMQIAAKQKMRFNERGFYLHTLDENIIKNQLGIDLSEVGDFCFILVCQNPAGKTQCETCNTDNQCDSGQSNNGYIATPETEQQGNNNVTETINFEVWAVLRNNGDAVATNQDTGNRSCTVQTNKSHSNGWVNNDNSVAGGQGRVVVLRYPNPFDGLDQTTGIDGIEYNWLNGFSISNAMK